MRKKPATLEAHRLYYLVMAPLLSVLPETLSHSDSLTVLKRKNVFLEDPQDVFFTTEQVHVVWLSLYQGRLGDCLHCKLCY